VKLTVLSHDLSSNAAMRAHRLATAALSFATVELIGPVDPDGIWPALPNESWIRSVPKTRFPHFMASFLDLTDAADGDVLLAVKPQLASYGVALAASERRGVPVVLDFDDLDLALAPRSAWDDNPAMTDLSRPGSAVYVSLLTKCVGAASAVTVASTALQRRFGGTLVRHGCDTGAFDPALVDREQARRAFGFRGPTVLFPGAPRTHKGLQCLAHAIQKISDIRLVVTCRADDLADEGWKDLPVSRIPLVPYSSLPMLLAAADVVAVPQLDTEAGSYQTPMKIFEAMAMAKPIVTTTVGDLPAIMEGCGKLVSPGNAEELATAILELLEKPTEAEALGERARARCIREFSLQDTGRQLAALVSQFGLNRTLRPTRHDRDTTFASSSAGVGLHVPPAILSDFALPFLARALDPLQFREELTRTLADVIHEPVDVRSIQVLRYKPGRRCLIEYHLQPGGLRSNPLTLLGKISARASRRRYEIQKAFWNAGFQDTSTDGISVPEPLGTIVQWHLWLQRKVSGSLATSLLEQNDAVLLVTRIADALAKIHGSGVETDRRHTLADEIATLRQRIARVIARHPRHQTRLERILARSVDLAAVMPQSRPAGIHRDFYADQIISNGDRLYLLDFDLYASGDPALDAGNFLGHLTEQSLRKWGHPDALSECESVFQDRFLQRSNGTTQEGVQAYAVLTLVRHIFLGTQFRERLHYADVLVDLCERRLELALGACRRTRHVSVPLLPD
jgi:glycosyltransferase involved in cell wall biosynthesis